MKGTPTVYLEIAPLMEIRWAGISMVAAHLAKELLGCREINTRFFLNNQVIKSRCVERYLRLEGGAYPRSDISRGLCQEAAVPVRFAPEDAAIWPNVKTFRRRFPRESQVIHDLSAVLTPQFHTAENILQHATMLLTDVRSNDRTFCVSEATRDDLVCYAAVPAEKTAVTPLGTNWPDDFQTRAQLECDWVDVEPYVVCIGTLEPRKNLRLVFEFLLRHPWLPRKLKFVFVGKKGWLLEASDFKNQFGGNMRVDEIERNLVFTDYVDRYTLFSLLRKAQFSIYPSCFEGFGLPVLEAMSAGCPVLCSYSSSLPEVGGQACIYFDPYSVDDFSEAFWSMLQEVRVRRDKLSAAGIARASQFTWQRFFTPYREWILESVVSNGVELA